MRTYLASTVRDAVADLLKTNTEVVATGATVVTRERGQLLSLVAQKIAALKLAVTVLPAEIVRVNPNTLPPLVEELRVALTVSESKLNDGPEGEELAELLLVLLHGRALPAAGPDVMLYAEEKPAEYAETPGGLALTTLAFRCVGLPAMQQG